MQKKLLWIKFNSKINFEGNMGDLYEKVSHKIYALPGITTCMSFFVKKEFLQTYFQNSDLVSVLWYGCVTYKL